VGRQVEPEEAPAGELVQQEVVGAVLRERADIAGEEHRDLLFAERRRERSQRGLGLLASAAAQLGLLHDAPAELVDRVDAHGEGQVA
jgi:hypothetical protein